MLVYDMNAKKIGIWRGSRADLPLHIQATDSMSVRQRTIIINSIVPLSMHVAGYLNDSTTNRIKEFKHHYQAMIHEKEEVNAQLLNTLLVGVEREYWFRMK